MVAVAAEPHVEQLQKSNSAAASEIFCKFASRGVLGERKSEAKSQRGSAELPGWPYESQLACWLPLFQKGRPTFGLSSKPRPTLLRTYSKCPHSHCVHSLSIAHWLGMH